MHKYVAWDFIFSKYPYILIEVYNKSAFKLKFMNI